MRLLDLELVLDEAIHPKNMIVLSFEFKLIANEEAELLLSLHLKLLQSFLENSIELLLYMGSLRIYLLYLEIDLTEIISELIFSSLDIWIDFLNL